ncbi:hypothetical protein [Halopiger goleimassiliensis]|uniref:hypothetical protein n=1 Tax=Halopiger goleimassiliensis TaxID=1293048 RepID=UPI0006777B36|nr:hypothetical protein [Halopiger goleimassiliensis]
MTADLGDDSAEECPDSVPVGDASSDCQVDDQATDSELTVLTDGGQAEMSEPDEDEGAEDAQAEDQAADEEAESEEATDEGTEDEAEVEDEQADEAPEDEAETEQEGEEEEAVDEEGEDEAEIEEGEEEEEAEDEAETEQEEEEEEAEDEAETEEEEEAEDDREEGHADDAEEVYEGDDASGVLHLDLDGLFLDLLGLEVNLNPVTLDVSARPGGNNLLGNLLSAVTGLLDGPGAMLDKAKSLLAKPLELLKAAPGKAKEWLTQLLGIGGDEGAEGDEESESGGVISRVAGWIRSILGKPVSWLRGLFGGDQAEEPDGEESEDEAEEAEGEAEEDESEEESESEGPLARLAGWMKDLLGGLVPSFPTEEIVSTIVSQVLEQLIDQLEPDEGAGNGEQPDAAEEAA